MASLRRWRRRVDKGLAKLSSAKERCGVEKESLARIRKRLRALEEAQSIAQAVAQRLQSQAHKQIAEIVTKCLAIFDEPYTFRIVFERKRGRTEARLVFERDGLEVDPLTASGGGVVDVAAFALRVAALVLARPALRRVLVMDEPFRFVSAEYTPRVRALLESLARDMGIQIVLVTHNRGLQAGVVHHLA